ncbi:alpha/beta fold hydrolase [Saccharopolyspora griseoalba]|uniref:Alpha/beta fold hydrolase n=1 Tax=Saccharopolyspora griseoalba TaxID=1431848 RepID=A0ABW2LLU3_9PSEU
MRTANRLPVFTDAQLRELRMPVLVIAGREDVMFDTAETGRRLREVVRGRRCARCPASGARCWGRPSGCCRSCGAEQ